MKTKKRVVWLTTMFAAVLIVFVSAAADTTTVPDLAGKWTGKSHFTGISYAEATGKKISPQDVEFVLQISTNGIVTGKMGDAELSGTVATEHRDWASRWFHIKSNFIIEGKLAGAVVAGSEGETHPVNIPFTFDGKRINGTVFAVYPVEYPYPFLSLKLTR